MGKMIKIAIAVFGLAAPLWPDSMVTFKIGKAQVQRGESTAPVSVGQKIHESDIIKTASNGRVSLRHSSGKILKIMPGNSIRVADLLQDKKAPGFADKIIKSGGLSSKPEPVVVAGVRANEEGKVDVLWADDPFLSAPVEWSAEWKALNQGKYMAVQKATSKAADAEGMYLNAMASYQLAGFSDVKKATKKLQSAKDMASYPELKDLCLKLQITINFKNGYFKEAYAFSKEFTRFKKYREIEEPVYYMFAASAEMAAPEKEYQTIKRKFAKAYPDSNLLKELN